MTEASESERVAVSCPSCSPSFETVHEILTAGGGTVTVRCGDCGHVHKQPLDRDETVSLQVIVSQDGESFPARVEAPAEETVRTGEEFVLDTEEAILAVRVTDLQVAPERRVEAASAGEIETVWTRAVDNVSVNVTIHPNDGSDQTRSLSVGLPGDHEFEVGSTEQLGEESVTIEGLYLRADAAGYPADKLDRRGDRALAKDLKRVYARDETTTAWSGW